MTEKFPIHVNRRFCHDFAVNMGIRLAVSRISQDAQLTDVC